MQRKTWNLACLFRLPAVGGERSGSRPFRLSAGAEPAAIAAFAEVDPAWCRSCWPAGRAACCWPTFLVRTAGTRHRRIATDTVIALVTAQARIGQPPPGLTDRRPEALAAAVSDLLDGAVGAELTPGSCDAARGLQHRWEMLADCGLPDTVVHGDFHPGNWRSDGGPAVVLDWSDAHLGNPVLDGLRAIGFLPPALRGAAAAAWTGAWTAAAPRSRPAEALRIAEPLAHLAYAVRYQEFLDNIEPSERVYHHGDPAASIRAALALP